MIKFCTGRQKCPKVSISVIMSQINVSLRLVCEQDRAYNLIYRVWEICLAAESNTCAHRVCNDNT